MTKTTCETCEDFCRGEWTRAVEANGLDWARRVAELGRAMDEAGGFGGLRQYQEAIGPFCREIFGLELGELEDPTIANVYAEVAASWLRSQTGSTPDLQTD